jgi:hypothetical protein
VFSQRRSGVWSPAERVRLIGLLFMSFSAVFFSVVPFVLLAIPISESACWRSLSLLLAGSMVWSSVRGLQVVRAEVGIPRSEREGTRIAVAIIVGGDLLVFSGLSANSFAAGVAWPYLAAIVWVLMKAALIFVRLVLVPINRAPADQDRSSSLSPIDE